MTEQIIEQSFNIAPIVGLLVCAVFALGLGIIFLYKKGDKDKKEYYATSINFRKRPKLKCGFESACKNCEREYNLSLIHI